MKQTRRNWPRMLVVSWLFFAVSFSLTFFIYGPLATPVVTKAGSPWATAAEQQAATAVLAVGGVLLLVMVLGLLGTLVCGISWFRARRLTLIEESADR